MEYSKDIVTLLSSEALTMPELDELKWCIYYRYSQCKRVLGGISESGLSDVISQRVLDRYFDEISTLENLMRLFDVKC